MEPASSLQSEMTLDLSTLYAATGSAKLAELPVYEAQVKRLVPSGGEVTLTGNGPIWLYLRLAHTLHGRARRLIYGSPVTGPVVIFDRDPN